MVDYIDIFNELIFQPLLFDNSDLYENRMSAVFFGMMRERKRTGIYLNETERVNISAEDRTLNGVTTTPFIIVDARSTTKVDSSTYRAGGSIGPRQVVAMNNLRVSLTNYSQINYSLEQGKFDNLTHVKDGEVSSSPTGFLLYQNYPNPFNPSTSIKFKIDRVNHTNTVEVNDIPVSLSVFNLLGEEVKTLINKKMSPGSYEIKFDGSQLSGGIYFYKLQNGNYIQTKKMILLK